MMKWFSANELDLSLRLKKIKFITKNSFDATLRIGCKERYTEDTHSELCYINTLLTPNNEQFAEV
jgi:hypothetical protein